MKPEQLKELIKTVAEIKELKPAKSPKHNRLATETIIEIDEDGEEYEVVKEITENPTLGFQLVKLKEVARECQLGCGDMVVNQVVEKRFCSTPEKHWRTRCQNCGCYVSPDGEGFIEGSHVLYNAYVRHFNSIKGIETPEPKPIKFNPVNKQEYEEIVINDTIIKRYK